jgi:hypothetical protein
MIIINPAYIYRQQQQNQIKLKQKEHSAVDFNTPRGKDLIQFKIGKMYSPISKSDQAIDESV